MLSRLYWVHYLELTIKTGGFGYGYTTPKGEVCVSEISFYTYLVRFAFVACAVQCHQSWDVAGGPQGAEEVPQPDCADCRLQCVFRGAVWGFAEWFDCPYRSCGSVGQFTQFDIGRFHVYTPCLTEEILSGPGCFALLPWLFSVIVL